MRKSGVLILVMVVVLTLGCGKEKEQSKADPSASPKTAVPVPEPVSIGTDQKADEQFLLSLLPLHEGKPSTLKIELGKIRAKGEPVTFKELDAWYKVVPPEQNAALSFLKITNNAPKAGWLGFLHEGLTLHAEREGIRSDRNLLPILDLEMRSRIRAYLTAHQLYVGQLFEIAQRYSPSMHARFSDDLTLGHSTRVPYLARIRSTAKILSWRSQFFASQKVQFSTRGADSLKAEYQQQAVSSILALLRINHLLDNEPFLASALVQSVSTPVATSALEILLNMRMLNDLQLVSLEKAFAGFNWPQRFSDALVGERVLSLELEEAIRSGTKEQIKKLLFVVGSCIFHENWMGVGVEMEDLWRMELLILLRSRTESDRSVDLLAYIGKANDLIGNIRKGYPHFATYMGEQGEYGKKWGRFDNITGPKYLWSCEGGGTVFDFRTVHRSLHAVWAQQQIALTALALERFRLANGGRIPRTLQELKPKYMTNLPFDPHAGKLLSYTPDDAQGAYELKMERPHNPDNPVNFKVNPSMRLK